MENTDAQDTGHIVWESGLYAIWKILRYLFSYETKFVSITQVNKVLTKLTNKIASRSVNHYRFASLA